MPGAGVGVRDDTHPPRIYPFGTVWNFRDFGGYPASGGRHVVRGKLFRSAHLARLSDAELAEIAALDIGLVVDLRYRPERERQPNRFWDDGPRAHFEFMPGEGRAEHKVAPHEAFIEHELHTPDDARRYMLQSYAARMGDPGFQAVFARTLRHMADTGDSLLIHCAAGKDRTGTLAALILLALGVERETVMDDFLLTLEAVDIEGMLEPAARMMSERHGRTLSPDAIRPMFGVERGYLEAALDAMGDPDAFLADALGLDARARARLVEAYTRPA